uniref:SGTA homodimerisation domain-containing protein n=2 Tax=Guillardia theta TaxID=55529 RepID=A0A7S4P6M1_GUITH|mmetsp:Transcript_44207/g.139466  ORF Transcript_44207/g.139466 Transcript_44207/m.139466 type:complete len:212 (+) Transcript_44207:21-656(+)
MHMYDEAINDCRKAIKIKPDFAKAYSRLGTAHFQAGRYKEALDEGYLTAAELEPSNQQYAKAIDLARSRLNEASNRAFPQGAGAAGGFDIDEALLGGAGGLFSNPELLQTLSALQGGCPGGFPNANSAGAMGNEGDGNAFLSQSAEAFQAALASPGFEDLRSSAKAQKIVSDLRQYGPMAFMNYVNDDEATDIINRLSSAALTHLGPPGYS